MQSEYLMQGWLIYVKIYKKKLGRSKSNEEQEN